MTIRKQNNNIQSFIKLLAIFTSFFLTSAQGAPFQPDPKVDSRGYIDVWQLRKDLAQIEPFVADANSDGCYSEGDADEDEKPLTPQQKKQRLTQEEKARVQEAVCVANIQKRYTDYRHMQDAFNAAWMPVILSAIKKGDKVAEVILIRCDTTPVLDRSRLPSTCSGQPAVRQKAINRLRDIGFIPAIPIQEMPGYCEFKNCGSPSPQGRETLQGIVLNAFKHGNFEPLRYEVTRYWEVKDKALNYRLARNAALIEAARQDVLRTFIISPEYAEFGDAPSLPNLALNRAPIRPGDLSWGPGILGRQTFEHHWRTRPFKTDSIAFGRPTVWGDHMTHPTDEKFEPDLQRLLLTTNENILRYLKQEPRWAIFLISRIGHHEWVPEGKQTDTGKLTKGWLGHWELVKHYVEFMPVDPAPGGYADITQEGSVTHISIVTTDKWPPYAPIQDIKNCILRYSGGLTPYSVSKSTDSTTLGDLSHLGKDGDSDFLGKGKNWQNQEGEVNGLEPFAHDKRYKQVLMQCNEAETPNNDRVRFLLLAGDNLVEIATDQTVGSALHFRHFKRAGSAGSSSASSSAD